MYRSFKDLPIGAVFGYHSEWTKRSTRTAVHKTDGWFYFRQTDLCEVK